MIKRAYQIEKILMPEKVLVIYGPRRVGKTTLVKAFLEETKLKYRYDTGENVRIQEYLSAPDLQKLKEYQHGYELLVIDEAQMIPGIGQSLKMLVDNVAGLKVIITGSSSFELAGVVGEPLTGRKRTRLLYPLSQGEMSNTCNKYELKEKLEEYLIYGSYPEVVTATSAGAKIEWIEEIVNSYLLKDILAYEKIKSSALLYDLLKLLAFQTGSLVSLNELSRKIKVDVKTVGRYIDLLEKSFVIKKIGGYSSNMRSEVTSKAKYYFIDNGIRNGVIRRFNPLNERDDVGQLWENFIVMERIRQQTYMETRPVDWYFWRTYQGHEVDMLEVVNNKLTAVEIKWSAGQKTRGIALFHEKYPNSLTRIIDRENYLAWLL